MISNKNPQQHQPISAKYIGKTYRYNRSAKQIRQYQPKITSNGEFTSRTVTLAASCTEVNPAFWKMWCIHGIRR
jgi:hypothetical protein